MGVESGLGPFVIPPFAKNATGLGTPLTRSDTHVAGFFAYRSVRATQTNLAGGFARHVTWVPRTHENLRG
jgi:hypothetical protein